MLALAVVAAAVAAATAGNCAPGSTFTSTISSSSMSSFAGVLRMLSGSPSNMNFTLETPRHDAAFRRQHNEPHTHTPHHTQHSTVVLFWDEPFLLAVGVVQLLELLVLHPWERRTVWVGHCARTCRRRQAGKQAGVKREEGAPTWSIRNFSSWPSLRRRSMT